MHAFLQYINGVYTGLDRIGGLAHGSCGGSFGLTVSDAYFRHMRFFDNFLHGLYGTGGTCHNTRSHVGEIRFGEILMPQHCDKHCGNSVEAGYFLLVYAGKSLFYLIMLTFWAMAECYVMYPLPQLLRFGSHERKFCLWLLESNAQDAGQQL